MRASPSAVPGEQGAEAGANRVRLVELCEAWDRGGEVVVYRSRVAP